MNGKYTTFVSKRLNSGCKIGEATLSLKKPSTFNKENNYWGQKITWLTDY